MNSHKIFFSSLIIFVLTAGMLYSKIFSIPVDAPNKFFFIENKGQWNSEVKYAAFLGNVSVFITKAGAVSNYFVTQKKEAENINNTDEAIFRKTGHVVAMEFSGAAPISDNQFAGVEKLSAYNNYFTGSNPENWVSHVPLFSEVYVKDVYPGIDVRYYFDDFGLRYDFVVNPGSSPKTISLTFSGVNSVEIRNNELIIPTFLGEVAQTDLAAFQETPEGRVSVPCRFIPSAAKNSVSFAVGNYNPSVQLIIDPLVYCTFLGGSSAEQFRDMLILDDGSQFITGYVLGSGFPVTIGAYDSTFNGGAADVFLTKMNADNTALIFSTYIGGSYSDYPDEISDFNGSPVIVGTTYSPDFPTTSNAVDQISNGATDVFVTKFSPDGSSLIFSTYIGGDTSDWSNSLDIDPEGTIYIAGCTMSSNFPVSQFAYDNSHNNNYDGFVTKLSAEGSTIIASTFLGGSYSDQIFVVRLDGEQNIYVSGNSTSPEFPVSPNAFHAKLGIPHLEELFCAKLNNSCELLLFSTFTGAEGSSFPSGAVIARNGECIIVGYTDAFNFPSTPSALDNSYNGDYDGFIARFSIDGTSLTYGSYFGGNNDDVINDISLSPTGSMLLCGRTGSPDFPVTPGAFDVSYSGSWDAFVSITNAENSQLRYSSFLSGTAGHSEGSFIDMLPSGLILTAGTTNSQDFPVTPGAFDTNIGYADEIFIAHFNPFLQFFLAAPNGGEVLYSGLTYPVRWLSTGFDFVTIQLSRDNGTSWATVASGVDASLLSYSWQVPDLAGRYCKIKIFPEEAPNLADISDAVFRIAHIPYIRVLSPNGGEVWSITLDYPIRWEAETLNEVRIDVSTDAGATWNFIQSYNALVGNFWWTVPNLESHNCLIKISDLNDPALFDVSDSLFIIPPFSDVSDPALPKEFSLEQNFPNPFNPATVIKYALPKESFVSLIVYNLLGEKITEIVSAAQPAGWYSVPFDASGFPSGMYLYRLSVGDFVQTKKMLIVK